MSGTQSVIQGQAVVHHGCYFSTVTSMDICHSNAFQALDAACDALGPTSRRVRPAHASIEEQGGDGLKERPSVSLYATWVTHVRP